MGEVKKPTDQERIAKLEQMVGAQAKTIQHMQLVGGFADAKTLGIRSKRIEGRVTTLEFDFDMLKSVAAFNEAMMADHLKDRHDVYLDKDDAPDVVKWRQIRHRLRSWAEKRGLLGKQRDTHEVRRGEGRFDRPRVTA